MALRSTFPTNVGFGRGQVAFIAIRPGLGRTGKQFTRDEAGGHAAASLALDPVQRTLERILGRATDCRSIPSRTSVATFAAQGHAQPASTSGGSYGQRGPALDASETVGGW